MYMKIFSAIGGQIIFSLMMLTALFGLNCADAESSTLTVTNPPPPAPFTVEFLSPTNGQIFKEPAHIPLEAEVTDTNFVEAVEYYYTGIGAGTNVFIGVVTNGNPFTLMWSNAPANNYVLTAIAMDGAGNTATSPPVNITITNSIVVTNPPPPLFSVELLSPTNGQTFQAPAHIALEAVATEGPIGGTAEYPIKGVWYYYTGIDATNVFIGVVTNGNPYTLMWSNAPANDYALTAIAIDSEGNMATSPPVNITITNSTVVTNPPPRSLVVNFLYPTNGQSYTARADIPLMAVAGGVDPFIDPVESVSYYYSYPGVDTNVFIGMINSLQVNLLALTWSNVPPNDYVLTAVAIDSEGNMATSPPVNIIVTNSITVTNPPPVISIFAPAPAAITGTNCDNLFYPATVMTNYIAGTNTATFLVHRNGETNNDVTVYYSIGGTASNGVDYVAIPGFVTIPAGKTYALIPIVPLSNPNNSDAAIKTVLLKLAPSANLPPLYVVGFPASAGVVIANENILRYPRPTIQNMPGGSVYVSLPASNGAVFCLETSTNMVDWQSICTNTVLNGSAQFVDPNWGTQPMLFYRIVPVNSQATY